ncbi:Hypothetical_protein [Hexamita inflata]|uniref:Hypothetical_protein n=1 Tax=Hexamita inflata TaxID=28002 RepID=A0AA86TE01_9EUKA|nr:Hypothetical protein HINF_LOCUS2491 [Hexamita inflata]
MYTFSLNSLSRIPGAAWGVFPVPRSCLLRETVIPSFILFYYFIPSSSLLVPQYSLFPFPSITLSLHSHSLTLHLHLDSFVPTPSRPPTGKWSGGGIPWSCSCLLSPPLLLTTTTTPYYYHYSTRDHLGLQALCPGAAAWLRGCGAWVGEAGVGVGAWVGWIAGWRGGGCGGIGQCINVGEYVVDIVQQ